VVRRRAQLNCVVSGRKLANAGRRNPGRSRTACDMDRAVKLDEIVADAGYARREKEQVSSGLTTIVIR
jgi:hypothetical protein